MKRNEILKFWLSIILLPLCAINCSDTTELKNDQKYSSSGPTNGYLMLVGGGMNENIWDEFKYLMGGINNHLVVIPTAINSDSLDFEFLTNYKQQFINLGFKNVTVLHTRDRKEANSMTFVKPLETASGVWFSGGRQWRHADSYLNTKTQEALEKVLLRGGIIGGSSAGATIQGSYLARGDTKANTIMVGDHESGFGFITNCAIDQHFLARNRHFDMFEILSKYPKLLGIGIDEKNTAIVVHKNRFRVIGESYVAIYDGTRWSEEKDTIIQLTSENKEFYFLSNGAEYDLEKRKIVEMEDREFIELSRDQMEAYVGKYKTSSKDYVVEFFIENDTLKAHESDESVYYLDAESPQRLYIHATDISFEFKFDNSGKAIRFFIPIGEESLKRIDD